MNMTTKNYTPTYPIVKMSPAIKRYLITLFIAGLAFTQMAFAQDRTITLDEAIKLGLDNSKQLKLSASKVDQAVAKYNEVMDHVLPTGSVSLAYNRAEIPANVLNFGTQSIHLPKNANAYLGIASLNENIYAGHKFKYAQESTKLLTQIARLDIVKDKNEITYDIIESYYNLYKVIQSKKIINQNLTSIDDQIHQSQRFFEQGLVTKNDVLRFQLQRSNVELSGIDLESNRKIINYNLDILLGLPENTQLTIAEIKEETHAVAPLANYIDTAMANRQELAQFDLRDKVAATNIKSIEANTLPTLSASAGGYYIDASANPLPQSGSFITPLTIGITGAWKFDALWLNKTKIAEARIKRPGCHKQEHYN